ncbi:MAG: ATP synthase F1 subunit epsilon [Actinomycetota bacterium]
MAEAREQRREGRQLFCRLITPETTVFDGEARMVVARIADGEIGVLADHMPLVSTVEVGAVRITGDGDERRVFATSDGFFKVSENLVQLLVEEAVPVEEIDITAAENRIEEAERQLSQIPEDDEEARAERRELERTIRMGENLVRVARAYRES